MFAFQTTKKGTTRKRKLFLAQGAFAPVDGQEFAGSWGRAEMQSPDFGVGMPTANCASCQTMGEVMGHTHQTMIRNQCFSPKSKFNWMPRNIDGGSCLFLCWAVAACMSMCSFVRLCLCMSQRDPFSGLVCMCVWVSK